MRRFYVYVMRDPFDGLEFYVGKGTGRRCFRHIRAILNGKGTCNRLKDYYVNKILKKGAMPIINIVKDGLTEDEALILEEYLIKTMGRIGYEENGSLTNILNSSLPNFMSGKIWDDVYGKDSSRERKIIRRDWLSNFNRQNAGKPRTASSRLKQSKTISGMNNHRYGKRVSDETKEKIRKKLRLRKGNKNSNAKFYIFICPNGNTYLVEGMLRQFCREQNLAISSVYNYLSNGPQRVRKDSTLYGWKLEQVK